MRTKRKQKIRGLHARPQSQPEHVWDWQPPPVVNVFRNLPEAYIEHEEQKIQEYQDFCPCCENKWWEMEVEREFEAYHREVTALSLQSLQEAMWSGNVDRLHELAPCDCCCDEHTSVHCPAREWNGCKSGLAPGEDEDDRSWWVAYYEQTRGMTATEFFAWHDEEA